jgi:hypothetical protein
MTCVAVVVVAVGAADGTDPASATVSVSSELRVRRVRLVRDEVASTDSGVDAAAADDVDV